MSTTYAQKVKAVSLHVFFLDPKRKDLLPMSLVHRKLHILTLLLLVLFVVAITVFVLLSFVAHTHAGHGVLTLGPDVWFPYP